MRTSRRIVVALLVACSLAALPLLWPTEVLAQASKRQKAPPGAQVYFHYPSTGCMCRSASPFESACGIWASRRQASNMRRPVITIC